MTMLHFEIYNEKLWKGETVIWNIGDNKPEELCDPLHFLQKCSIMDKP